MTKTKAIKKIKEFIDKYGEDFILVKFIDKCKQKIAWYEGKRLPDDECIYSQVTLKDIYEKANNSESWNPNDLRDTLKRLEKGQTKVEKSYISPEESKEELKKYEEEHPEAIKKKEEELNALLSNYKTFYKYSKL